MPTSAPPSARESPGEFWAVRARQARQRIGPRGVASEIVGGWRGSRGGSQAELPRVT